MVQLIDLVPRGLGAFDETADRRVVRRDRPGQQNRGEDDPVRDGVAGGVSEPAEEEPGGRPRPGRRLRASSAPRWAACATRSNFPAVDSIGSCLEVG